MSDSWDDYASDWDQNADARSFADLVFRSLIEHVDVRRLAWRRRLGLTLGAVANAFTEADLVCVHFGEAFTTTSGNSQKSVLVGVARPTAHATPQTFINRLG